MPDPEPARSFADLALRPELLEALSGLGYEEPTPIQEAAIGPLIEGRDLLGQAATGTGKTAAFALPILQRLIGEGDRRNAGPFALVLVPMRELAMQVSEAVHRYGKALGVRVLPVYGGGPVGRPLPATRGGGGLPGYGGQPIGRQLQAMRAGVDVVIATPGRALDHLRRGSLQMGTVKM